MPLHPSLLRKTLVINFEGTMYTKEIKVGDGMLLNLRPGFKKFLKNMSQLYDIVIFSREDTSFLEEVVTTIDPKRLYLRFIFGNEFLLTKGNGRYKDLQYLNRSMKKVVALDFNQDDYLNNNNNVLFMKKYNGETYDDSLRQAQIFLKHLANPKVRDVRKEIKKYGGFDESIKNYWDKFEKKYQQV